MASERQVAANRANAKKSSGPRSAASKARSRHNAFSHGLSIGSRLLPAFQQDVIMLAQLMSPAGADIWDDALVAAEAEIDVLRVRRHRVAVIEEWRRLGRLKSFNLTDQLEKL